MGRVDEHSWLAARHVEGVQQPYQLSYGGNILLRPLQLQQLKQAMQGTRPNPSS